MSDRDPGIIPPIDPAWLERMLARPDFARRLFSVFLADEPARLDALGKAIAEDDQEAIRFLAHSLKGASATLGMARVSAACKILEQHAKSGDTTLLHQAFEDVAQEMHCVFDAIKALQLFAGSQDGVGSREHG